MLEQIKEVDVPAIYELGVGQVGKSLLIKIHSEAWDYITPILAQEKFPLRDILQQDFDLAPFEIPSSQAAKWGFGGNITRAADDRDGWVSWQYSLPQAEGEIYWPTLYAGSASLNILFLTLGLIEEGSGYSKPQLIHINLHTAKGMHGGSLWVHVGKSLLPWLTTQEAESRHKGIEDVMKTTYGHIRGMRDLSLYRFLAYFRQPHWINLDCPGDACGLDPENYYDDGQGYDLTPHNVDSPLQQLTLLMGIAALHDEARKAGF